MVKMRLKRVLLGEPQNFVSDLRNNYDDRGLTLIAMFVYIQTSPRRFRTFRDSVPRYTFSNPNKNLEVLKVTTRRVT